jgi:hypothetical protein
VRSNLCLCSSWGINLLLLLQLELFDLRLLNCLHFCDSIAGALLHTLLLLLFARLDRICGHYL